MEEIDMRELVESLGSPDDSIRKRAAFRLQSMVGDPSFADNFESEGGIAKLRSLALNASGNTLAYCLAAYSRLLELDQGGWNTVDQKLIGRLVYLVVNQQLVNILRGAMSILALVVARAIPNTREADSELYGFRALKPAVEAYPNFLEILVSKLAAADHALCANALQLMNALMRDSITNDADDEWPKFIKRLQDLGVIKAVYNLMQGTGLQDLAPPLLEFQCLTKILLRKWRDTSVDQEKKEHRRALKAIHLASKPVGYASTYKEAHRGSKDRDPQKWRKIGFATETPTNEFKEVGFLGVMDLADFARKSEDGFHKLVLEQATKPVAQRCPVARASLAITEIIYDHFEIDSAESEDRQRNMALDSRVNFDKLFKPVLLQWSRLHTAGLQAFLRVWASTGAEVEDFKKVEELVRILIEHVVGLASRVDDVSKIEQDLANYELQQLRELQMELLELTHEDAWGHHLRQIKEDLHHESLQFLKEQRIRCLLAGSWFPNIPGTLPLSRPHQASNSLSNPPQTATTFAASSQLVRPSIESYLSQSTMTIAAARTTLPPYRFVRLSHNRRYLHYADFDMKTEEPPSLALLEHKIALTSVTSVVSNVSPSDTATDAASARLLSDETYRGGTKAGMPRISLASNRSSGALATTKSMRQSAPQPQTTITILGTPPTSTPSIATNAQAGTPERSIRTPHMHNPSRSLPTSPLRSLRTTATPNQPTGPTQTSNPSTPTAQKDEQPLLTLQMSSQPLAAEWLDGLLMLMNQGPITAETNSLVDFVARYGLKIRLLNVRFEEGLNDAKSSAVGVDEGQDLYRDRGSGAVDLRDNGGTIEGRTGMAGLREGRGGHRGEVVLPSREGVDEEFYYDVAGA